MITFKRRKLRTKKRELFGPTRGTEPIQQNVNLLIALISLLTAAVQTGLLEKLMNVFLKILGIL